MVRIERRLREQLERSELQVVDHESTLTEMMRGNDTIQEDRDSVRAVIDAVRADVVHTRRALARLSDGTYGNCISCHSAIPGERLEAIPTVLRCARCA